MRGKCSTPKASRVFPTPIRLTQNLHGCQGEGVPVGLVKSVAGYNQSQRPHGLLKKQESMGISAPS